MDPVSATLAIGSVAAKAITSARRKKIKVNKINEKFMGMRPEGYTTAADNAQAELLRQKGTASAARSGTMARQQAGRQIVARGLGGASAAALRTQGDQIEAGGRELAAEGAANFLGSRYADNLGFERGKVMTAWGAELGDAQREAARRDAQDATFWNSALEAVPALMGSVPALGKDAPAASLPASSAAAALPNGGTYIPSVIPTGRGPGVGAYR